MITSERIDTATPAPRDHAGEFADALDPVWHVVANGDAKLFVATADGQRTGIGLEREGGPGVVFLDDGKGFGPLAFGRCAELASYCRVISVCTDVPTPATVACIKDGLLAGKWAAVIVTAPSAAEQWERTLANWFRIDWTPGKGETH